MSAPADWKINVPAAPAMDWPTAWQYIREQHPDPAEHHPSCSWVQTNRALLCDCDVLWDEYVRRGGSDPRAAAVQPPEEQPDVQTPHDAEWLEYDDATRPAPEERKR